MQYKNIKEGKFISRPNRFIANVEIDGGVEFCHVKNTGRCRELLVEGARVFLEMSENKKRKTKYDLVAVYKGDALFNIDSTAPNIVFGEWIEESGYFGKPTLVKPEKKHGDSRIDYYIETENRKIFAEIKGVTLENDEVLSFPDAPTERGRKHLVELCRVMEEGYEAYAVFVVQTDRAKYFTPNAENDKKFAKALSDAKDRGVKILCLSCNVTKNSLSIKEKMEIRLTKA